MKTNLFVDLPIERSDPEQVQELSRKRHVRLRRA
jgi:hypothetical protein